MVGLCLATLLGGRNVGAQGSATAVLAPSPLELDTQPQPLRVEVYDAPPFVGYELELRYPPESLRVTAVEAGSLVAAPGQSIQILALEAGRLRIAFDLGLGESDEDETDDLEAGDEADGADASLESSEAGGSPDPGGASDPASLPQGNGSLALFTLAPIARSEAPVSLELVDVVLLDEGEQRIELESTGGEAWPRAEPEAELRDAYIAQAEAMEISRGDGGLGTTIRTAFRDLARRAEDLASNPTANWLGILVLALAVVGLAWQFGRKPIGASEAESAASSSTGSGLEPDRDPSRGRERPEL